MISVIITTYKRPVFLERALKSVLNQTYKNIEIIIVDDNDEDTKYRSETEKLVKTFPKHLQYIKLQKNAGACNARNIGLEKTKGSFILFLDDDDELLPKHLELLRRQYDASKELGVVFSQAKIIDVKKKTVNKTNKKLEITTDPLLWHLMVGANSTSSILFKKAVILEVGGWIQQPFGHENYLMVRIFDKGYKGISIPEHTVNIYFEDTERISNNLNRLKGIDILYDKISPHVKKYPENIQKSYRYNFFKNKVLLNIGINYKHAVLNYKKMLSLDFFNKNNLKFLILLLFPYPNFLVKINNFYRTLFPKTL